MRLGGEEKTLITIPVSVMLVLTFLSIIVGSDWSYVTTGGSVGGNTSEGFFGMSIDANFSIDPLVGMIAVLIILVSVTAILGIRLLSSGLSETSVKTLSVGLFYLGVWAMFSALSEPLIRQIPVFGGLIYIALTISYTLGVVKKIQGGGMNE